jgi:transcriptional regulator with XRE-family HTH domain
MDDGQQTLGPAEGKIGRVLERARKDKGLSLEDAERATKIRKRYLIGLERDDYTVLPDAVYARGFLKTYANFLGLDGTGLSQELHTRRKPRRERGLSYAAPKSEFEGPIISPGGVPGAEKRRVSKSAVVTVVVAALVIAALVGALYFVGLNVRSAADDAPDAARMAAQGAGEAREPDAPKEVPSEEVSSGALTVGVEVEGVPAWIRVRSDSETVFEEVARPGFSRTFEARRVVGIRAGDAGAVSVKVNGQDVGTLGDPGQVLDRSFTLKSAS